MKLYIVFRVKDMSRKSKRYILDSVYPTETQAFTRMIRIHKILKAIDPKYNVLTQVMTSDKQITYMINTPLRHKIKK